MVTLRPGLDKKADNSSLSEMSEDIELPERSLVIHEKFLLFILAAIQFTAIVDFLIILPLGPDRTVTRFEWYVLEPNSPGVAEEFARSFAFSDQVQQEDIGICEAVQKGLRSRTYDHGRYSVLRENGVHHFHGLLTKALR